MNTPPSDPRSHDLADRLARRAGTIDLGPPMVEVVVARGRRRRQRRRAVVGVAAVAGVCAASVVAIETLSRPSSEGSIVAAPVGTEEATATTITVSSEPEVATTIAGPIDTLPAAPITTVDSPFVWNRVDPGSSEAVTVFWGGPEPTMAGSGPFVAWSTSPGVTDSYSQVMWRSDDGIRWEQVTDTPRIGSRSVAERNGRFFAYGTTPATASSGRKSDLALGVSDDGGRTWDTKMLPIDTSALAAEPGVASVGVNATSIATSAAGVLVSAQISASIDFLSLLPPEYRDGGFEYDDTGITMRSGACLSTVTTVTGYGTVAEPASTIPADTTPAGTEPATSVPVGAPGCPSERFTWADLGVSEIAARASLSPETRVFLSTDGETFEEIDAPAASDTWIGLRFTAFGDGFAAVTAESNADGSTTSTLWFSDDGRTWTDGGVLPVGYPEAMGTVGDRLVVAGWNWTMNRQYLAVRDAAGTWTTTELAGFALPSDGRLVTVNASHVSITDAGISIIGWLYADPIAEVGGVSFTKDGITVFIDDMSQNQRVVDAATGELLGAVGPGGGTSEGGLITQRPDDGVYEVRREPGGEIVTTYSYTDIEQLITEVGGYDPSNSTLLFLHSPDGITWSRESLDDLAGAPVSSSGGIRVADGQVLVAVNLRDDRNPNGTAKQAVLVATPKA